MNKKNVFFVIFDSGKPFDKTVLDTLGKEKITTHKNEGGSGIGLFTAHHILKDNGGTFKIRNAVFSSRFTKSVEVRFCGNR